jgi:hypothetical protein
VGGDADSRDAELIGDEVPDLECPRVIHRHGEPERDWNSRSRRPLPANLSDADLSEQPSGAPSPAFETTLVRGAFRGCGARSESLSLGACVTRLALTEKVTSTRSDHGVDGSNAAFDDLPTIDEVGDRTSHHGA